jgi:site-specific DNA recombinase
MPRFALYARFSSDLQRETSIDDQLRVCRQHVTRLGGDPVQDVVGVYRDSAKSGASMKGRSGILALLADAKARKFDVVVAEALDRLSRDQEDTAHIHKRLSHYGVKLITISENDVTEMHVAFKSLINSQFLKDVRAKVKRGMLGRVEAGFAAASLSYGYDVVRDEVGPDGELVRGKRRINPERAAIVLRVFREFVAGRSPLAIAQGLNADGIKPPRGREWNSRVISGSRAQRTGILYNEAYLGRIVFNRTSWSKDPDTGRRVKAINPESEWVRKDVPHLRIVPDDLWEAAQRLKARYADKPAHLARRPKRLLSGLLTCGVCGGPMNIVERDSFGCQSFHGGGACTNRRVILCSKLERRVLAGLRDQLVSPEMFEEFSREYRAAWKRRQEELSATKATREAAMRDTEARLARLVAALEAGADVPELRNRVGELSAQRRALADELKGGEAPSTVDPHPALLSRAYIRKLARLETALTKSPTHRAEAIGILRTMIDRIVLYPGERRGGMRIELRGDIAGILALASETTATGTSPERVSHYPGLPKVSRFV